MTKKRIAEEAHGAPDAQVTTIFGRMDFLLLPLVVALWGVGWGRGRLKVKETQAESRVNDAAEERDGGRQE